MTHNIITDEEVYRTFKRIQFQYPKLSDHQIYMATAERINWTEQEVSELIENYKS
jgi:hypothetical protein